jgi:hypothetical protein
MIIDDYLDYLQEGSVKKKVVAAAVVTAISILGVSYQGYKKLMDAAEKSCKNTPNKEVCMATFRYRAYKTRMNSLKSRLKDCAKTDKPGKCRKYIKKTITSLGRRIK